jgi:hypothetical protein
MMQEESFYFRTSDLWHAAAFWALGHPLRDTEIEDDRVVFVFADGGGTARENAASLLRGDALVKPEAMKHGYYQMRDAIRDVRHEQRA